MAGYYPPVTRPALEAVYFSRVYQNLIDFQFWLVIPHLLLISPDSRAMWSTNLHSHSSLTVFNLVSLVWNVDFTNSKQWGRASVPPLGVFVESAILVCSCAEEDFLLKAIFWFNQRWAPATATDKMIRPVSIEKVVQIGLTLVPESLIPLNNLASIHIID